MKLNRAQEEILIEIGLNTLLDKLVKSAHTEPIVVVKTKNKPKGKRKWSPEQREKFRATMQKVWARKKKLPKG